MNIHVHLSINKIWPNGSSVMAYIKFF